MNKNWKKAIYKRTRFKNIYNKNRSRDNWNNYKINKKREKKERNLCTNLSKKSMKRHSRNA